MALAKATKQHIAKVADSAATLQLASEEAARRLTEPVLVRASDALVANVAVQGLENRQAAFSAAARAVRHTQKQVQAEFTAAMLEARSIAHEFALRQLALEAAPLIGAGVNALSLAPSLAAAEIEAMWAEHAGTAMARQFGSTAIAETMAWQQSKKPPSALLRSLGRVRARLEPERQLHIVSQSVGAFAEAKRDGWNQLNKGRAKTLPGIPASPGAGRGGRGSERVDDGMRDLWSAILDTKSCPICWKLDGQMVKPGEPFHEGAKAPLHRRCRCTVVTIHIPAELERYLPGAELDYDALKDDIKDYMGSRKFDVGEGVRHAKRYVDDVLEKRGHSPVVLTQRVNNRRDYFPNVPIVTAPPLLARW